MHHETETTKSSRRFRRSGGSGGASRCFELLSASRDASDAERAVAVSCLISVPDLRLGGVLCSLEYIACGRRTRYVPRILGSEIHPSRVHGLKHFFGRSGVALRDAELFEPFRPPCTRDCKGFHVELQDFTQLLRDLIRADHRTKLDDEMPWPGWPGQKGCDLRADAGEGEGHHRDQRAVTQADEGGHIDAVE